MRILVESCLARQFRYTFYSHIDTDFQADKFSTWLNMGSQQKLYMHLPMEFLYDTLSSSRYHHSQFVGPKNRRVGRLRRNFWR